MKKRLMYLNHLLTNGKNKLPAKVLRQQMKEPLKGDWITMCKKDMEELHLDIKIIEDLTKPQMKKYLNKSIQNAAFEYLKIKQSKQSKGKEIFYHNIETQSYLRPESKLSVNMMQKIFQLRS